MTRVYVSHADADSDAAGRLADALDAAGLRSWAGRPADGDPGEALARCAAVVLLASRAALDSARMSEEVIRAYELGKPFVPVLTGISHLELTTQQPAWRTAIGSATAIEAPSADVVAVAPRVVAGVRALTAPVPRQQPVTRTPRRIGLVVGLGVVMLALIAALVVWAVGRGGDGNTSNEGAGPSGAATSSTGTEVPVLDSATARLHTSAGDLSIMQASFSTRFCAVEPDCVETTGSDRLVVVTMGDLSLRKLDFTEEFSQQMGASYVQSGDQKAGYALAWQDTISGWWGVAYKSLPDSALSGDVRLVWPGSQTLLLHPVEE